MSGARVPCPCPHAGGTTLGRGSGCSFREERSDPAVGYRAVATRALPFRSLRGRSAGLAVLVLRRRGRPEQAERFELAADPVLPFGPVRQIRQARQLLNLQE